MCDLQIESIDISFNESNYWISAIVTFTNEPSELCMPSILSINGPGLISMSLEPTDDSMISFTGGVYTNNDYTSSTTSGYIYNKSGLNISFSTQTSFLYTN